MHSSGGPWLLEVISTFILRNYTYVEPFYIRPMSFLEQQNASFKLIHLSKEVRILDQICYRHL
mgnify:CR=1 FL=1